MRERERSLHQIHHPAERNHGQTSIPMYMLNITKLPSVILRPAPRSTAQSKSERQSPPALEQRMNIPDARQTDILPNVFLIEPLKLLQFSFSCT